MQRPRRWLAVATMAGAVALSGCGDGTETEASEEEPATLVEINGSDVKQVVLTKRAVERLGIATAVVADVAGAKVIPYAAVVYDPKGATWAYTSPKPLTFVRTSIAVATISGEQAILSAGPDIGTAVVTVGTAELYGTENEIGH